MNEVKTEALVLRRMNYEEADRIVRFLTPLGVKVALAKSVRRQKAKLAPVTEMFSLSTVVLHMKSGGVARGHEQPLAVLIGGKTEKFYRHILDNLENLELASGIVRAVSKIADAYDSPELFELVRECFEAIDTGVRHEVVRLYFGVKFAYISGEDVNLYTDSQGEKLEEGRKYRWDGFSKVLVRAENGEITANHIKLLRLILASPLKLVLKVQGLESLVADLTEVGQSFKYFS